MATTLNAFLTFTSYALALFFVFEVHAVPYDYSYVLGCVPKPKAPQYHGGIVVNPRFNHGLKGWTAAGAANIAIAQSHAGRSYAVVSNTVTVESDGLAQWFNAERGRLYTVSAWFQTSVGEAAVQMRVVTSTDNHTAGWITAKAGCWTMLKGGFQVNVTEPALLQLEV